MVPFDLCRRAGALMIAGGRGGRIVNIGSLFGQPAVANGSAYCASKGGLTLLTHALGLELGGNDITVVSSTSRSSWNSTSKTFLSGPSTPASLTRASRRPKPSVSSSKRRSGVEASMRWVGLNDDTGTGHRPPARWDSMPALILVLAIAVEIAATTLLKFSDGFTRPIPAVLSVVGYVLSLFLLSRALLSIPVSVAYAVWAGADTAIVAAIAIAAAIGVAFLGEALGLAPPCEPIAGTMNGLAPRSWRASIMPATTSLI